MKMFLTVVIALTATTVAGAATPDEPWLDAPPFTVATETLVSKVRARPAPDAPAEILLEEMSFQFDDAARLTKTYHALYRVLDQSGVDDRSWVNVRWAPWYESRPEVKARIVSADGVAHDLDGATLGDEPLGDDSSSTVSDRRVLTGPLPAVEIGSVVELTWTIVEGTPPFIPSHFYSFVFGDSIPVRNTKVTIDAPAGLAVVARAKCLPSVSMEKSEHEGRVLQTFRMGALPKLPDRVQSLPFDVDETPIVELSVGAGWPRIAGDYSDIVDKQIGGGQVGGLASAGKGLAGQARIEAIVRALHATVRYSGVEFRESTIVPAPPAETSKRRFGDCKDKATLLVALLRGAGLQAHVALVATGLGRDPDPDLPGIEVFDHAIVVVEGTPRLWIDATADNFRVGDLPIGVAGRLALVASKSTPGMERIPESTAARNRIETSRDLYLGEIGPARIVETVRSTGVLEAMARGRNWSISEADWRKKTEADAKRIFKAKALGDAHRTPPSDLTQPFVETYEAVESPVGQTFADASSPRFPQADFVSRLSDELPTATDATDKAAKPRTQPFHLENPFVDVWTVRVHPPPGFAPGEPPKTEDTTVGPVRFTRRFRQLDDGVLEFQATLDTGDRLVWSTEELAQVRAWIDKLKKSDDVQIVVEQVGYKALQQGRIGDAIAEYSRLAQLHPKEALHHSQLATAFLRGGVGEAARSEARRAVTLEPGSATTWVTYSFIYSHDLIGRPFENGADIAETERAARKAMELDPKDETARRNLAVALEYDPKTSERYGRRARLMDAISVWQGLKKDLDTKAYDQSLLVALARADRWSEVRDLASDADTVDDRVAWVVAATEIGSGIDDATAEAGRRTGTRTDKNSALVKASTLLLQLRRYPESAALLRAASTAAGGDTSAPGRADVIARCRRHETMDLSGDDAESFLKRFFVEIASGDDPVKILDYVSPMLAGSATDPSLDGLRNRTAAMRGMAGSGMTSDGVVDVALAQLEWHTEGNPDLGYKITMRLQVPGTAQSIDWFLQRENGALKIVGTSQDVQSLGIVALRRLDIGRIEDARQWLTWARDEFPGAHADFLDDTPFVAAWNSEGTMDAAALKSAAAALGCYRDGENSLRILTEAAGSARSDDEKFRLEYGVQEAYWTLGRPTDALPLARRYFAAHPSTNAFDRLGSGLLIAKAYDELAALCVSREADHAMETVARRLEYRIAYQQRRWEEADRALRQLVDQGKGNDNNYNSLAWIGLFRGDDSPRLVDDAERAALRTSRSSSINLHTLAAVYAEVGRFADAQQTLVKMIAARASKSLERVDWLVIGRLAERYGARDEAIAAYRRIERPKHDWDLPGSTFELAQTWLERLSPPAPADRNGVRTAPRKGRGL
ncbi:MAG TPA: DUF3857 domain-containing protein [Candidatus Polarisedimenticolaceae bacterium]|nr:DUF3857 domain-containing protein [Candidatus Polarisedimenticolaceae bacterium]